MEGFYIFLLALFFIVLFVFVYFVPVRLWVAAYTASVRVSILSLIGMRLRRVPPSVIVNPLINATKAGLDLSTDQLEAHYLSGGNVYQVIQALISADKANIPLTFERAAAIDLAGRDVFEAVQMSVRPKVIDAPDPSRGSDIVAAVAMDGIQLRAKAKVTVKANLDRLVGGATEETIIARVGEGIVTTIGSAVSHKKVLENPDLISKNVLAKGLDSGTGFEILSIDIADIDVGDNIGAKLQIDQANADKQIAQAKAEERKAMAIAQEQEMRARVEEMRARVVEAEAQVPLAMADAFRSGNLGVMDYYNMKNIMADTQMRETIAKPSDAKQKDSE
ncbi:MAG: flotillin-like protein FloA [Candidatus Omnitrophica bacterium]|nr:flotillin-like protein FloA [Candidatus Omnitrophota bacterium]